MSNIIIHVSSPIGIDVISLTNHKEVRLKKRKNIKRKKKKKKKGGIFYL